MLEEEIEREQDPYRRIHLLRRANLIQDDDGQEESLSWPVDATWIVNGPLRVRGIPVGLVSRRPGAYLGEPHLLLRVEIISPSGLPRYRLFPYEFRGLSLNVPHDIDNAIRELMRDSNAPGWVDLMIAGDYP